MVDDELRRLAKDEGWFTVHVCRLMDAAYALMDARLLLRDAESVRERMREDLHASRAAKTLYSAIDSRTRAIVNRTESMLREYGVDPGRTHEEARRLWSQLTELSYLVPTAPRPEPGVNADGSVGVQKG